MDLMAIRRSLLMMQEVIAPPSGYEFIEYAQTKGRTAYVSLPFGFDKTDIIHAKFAVTDTENSDRYAVAPQSWNTNNNRFGMGIHRGFYTCAYGAQTTGNTALNPEHSKESTLREWVYKNYVFSIPELESSRDVSNISFGGTTANLKLFYGYNYTTNAKIAYYRHEKSGGTVYDIRPIRNLVSGDVEMYDVVSKTIMTRNGTLYAPD